MDRDYRFETVINERKGEKEVRTMSEWLSRVINTSEARGEARGITIGEEKGRIMELASLVRDQIITISEAAKRMKMTESEFCQKTGISLPQ